MKLIFLAFPLSLLVGGCSVSALIESLKNGATVVGIDGASSYSFGTVSTVAISVDRQITLKNDSEFTVDSLTSSLSYSSTSLATTPFRFKAGTYPGTGGTCANQLAAKSSCNVVLTYDPSIAQTDGGTIAFNFSVQGVTGKAEASLAGVGVTPAILAISDVTDHDFGSVLVGVTSAVKTFTVTNTGGDATSVMEASLAPPFAYAGGAFPGTAGTCSTSLAAGDSCTVKIVFTPVSPGLATGTTTLSYNDGLTTQSVTHNIQGTGTNPNVAPVAAAQTVTVFSADKSIALSATDANGDVLTYTVVAGPTHGTLSGTAPNLTYTPTAAYLGADSFTFKANDGTADSNIATITIDVQPITIFLRSAIVTPAGDDGTAVVSDASHPFLTAQAAVQAALTVFASDSAVPIVIDVGVGNFGDVTIGSDLLYDLTWKGVSSAQSIVGNIIASGADGNGGYIGIDGLNGFSVKLASDGDVTFGSVNTNGGVGLASDFTNPAVEGNGGNGGSIEIGVNVIAGSLDSRGGNGGANLGGMPPAGGTPGAAGNIIVRGRVGHITAVGGASVIHGGSGGSVSIESGAGSADITTTGGGGPLDGGASGQVIVKSGAQVVGNIDASGGISELAPGSAGTITVFGTVTGNIYSNGVGSGGSTAGPNGNAGNVTVESSGVVTGEVWVNAGNGYASVAGNITMKGSSGSLYADGTGGSFDEGSNGGSINVSGTVTGDVSAIGGDGGITNSKTAGNGGSITISGTVSGDVRLAGGGVHENLNAGNAGTIVLLSGANIGGTILASGGANSSVIGGVFGGNGANVEVVSGAIVSHIVSQSGSSYGTPGVSGNIIVRTGGVAGLIFVGGGAGSSGGSWGAIAGTVVVEAGATTLDIQAVGAYNYIGVGGDGGTVSYSSSALSYGSVAISVDPGNGLTGFGNPGVITYP